MDLNTEQSRGIPCVFTLFGGTGDLAKRKLIPALFKLFKDGKLSDDFAVVAVGRKDLTDESYRAMMKQSTAEFSTSAFRDEDWNLFCEKLFYSCFDFLTEAEKYGELDRLLNSLDKARNTSGNRIYYLAVGPEMFEPIVDNLKINGMIENRDSWQRVMIEKPFGSSLSTARKLNESLLKALPEEKFFRIDHYLGKEMVQNITAIRFSNSIFEPLWNYRYIDNIQILSSETIGVEHRGDYYENSGILRDMLQNHILQMLSLVCMEPPLRLDAESIRDEKVKVLKSLRLFDEKSAVENIVLGQYGAGGENNEIKSYREEVNVSPNSEVPTFVALKANIDNYRWGGVPIYIKAGKRLEKRSSKIVIQFKQLPGTNFYEKYKHSEPNYLVVKIQPSEGMMFQVNTKKPGSDNVLEKVEMDYCQTCKYSINSQESYERLIFEAILGNASLFTRWDELEFSWRYIDSIERSISNMNFKFPNYEANSRGPKEVFDFIHKDSAYWWDYKGE